MRKYCPDCYSDELVERPEAGYGDVKCGECGAVFGPSQCLTPPPEPDPRPGPLFKVGDRVWAFNGQPRIVTGVRWGHCVPSRACGQITWHWWLDTVHPDDPEFKGVGAEENYLPMRDFDQPSKPGGGR